MRGPRVRTLALIIVPIAFSCAITTWAALLAAQSQLETRSTQFGNALAEQLAITVADPLVQRDLLSLNVILSELLSRGNFAFASVYSADNRLLAQSGKMNSNLTIFARDVVFQDAAAGYVHLGLDQSGLASPIFYTLAIVLLVQTGFIACLGIGIWFYGDLFVFWLASPTHGTRINGEAPAPGSQYPAETIDEVTILVIRIRPTRQFENNRTSVMKAIELYKGQPEASSGDDLIVTFHMPDQIFQAVCCGMLIKSIMKRSRGVSQVRLGMHRTASTQQSQNFNKARKQAAYLASISDDEILTSYPVFMASQDSGRIVLQEFHSSLTPAGEVYYVESLNKANQTLIERQADQLA